MHKLNLRQTTQHVEDLARQQVYSLVRSHVWLYTEAQVGGTVLTRRGPVQREIETQVADVAIVWDAVTKV